MNLFQSTESGSGMLKDSYADNSVSEALKRRRERLAQSLIGLEPEKPKDEDDGED
jgi:hypothetical protein